VAQRPKWWHQLQAAKNEARLAVDLYNRPTESRSLEGFVVHMHLAWVFMLHAHFLRDGVDFRYREKDGRRFVKVDGEPKTWELAQCWTRFRDTRPGPAQHRVLHQAAQPD